MLPYLQQILVTSFNPAVVCDWPLIFFLLLQFISSLLSVKKIKQNPKQKEKPAKILGFCLLCFKKITYKKRNEITHYAEIWIHLGFSPLATAP